MHLIGSSIDKISTVSESLNKTTLLVAAAYHWAMFIFSSTNTSQRTKSASKMSAKSTKVTMYTLLVQILKSIELNSCTELKQN